YDTGLNLYDLSGAEDQGGGGGDDEPDITTGLVGYWPLDGNLNDSTPYSHNGTAQGGTATYTTGHNGVANTAFVGGNGKRAQFSATGLPTSTVSVSAWMYQPSYKSWY